MDTRLRQLTFSCLFCLATLFLAGCGQDPTTDPRTSAPLVRSVVVTSIEPESRTFTGIVAARVQSDIGFRVAGKVSERLVDAGQTVKRGQVLMRLDPTDLKLAVAAQEELVAAAKARARQASEDETRYRDLKDTGAVSASAYDQIKAAADAANAQLNAAKAQEDVQRNASRYADLIADADGVVTETFAEPGQVVSPGQPMVRLAHTGGREAVIQLPETLRPALGSMGRATLYGQENVSEQARMRQLASSTDRITRTFEARYALQGSLAHAPLGSTVTIQIPVRPESRESGVQVPISSLHNAGKGPGIWLISGEPTRVTWRPVNILRLSDDSARVVGQLHPGDHIVALGAHLLHEGQRVRMESTSGEGRNRE